MDLTHSPEDEAFRDEVRQWFADNLVGDFARIKNGVAYLALATGAPVVPVACIGTRVAGVSVGKPSPKGTRIDIVYGAPVTVEAQPFPRRQSDLAPDQRGLAVGITGAGGESQDLMMTTGELHHARDARAMLAFTWRTSDRKP